MCYPTKKYSAIPEWIKTENQTLTVIDLINDRFNAHCSIINLKNYIRQESPRLQEAKSIVKDWLIERL